MAPTLPLRVALQPSNGAAFTLNEVPRMPQPRTFETCASADSATPASERARQVTSIDASAQQSSASPDATNGATACRFWTKVDRSGGPRSCWPWLGAINKVSGYPYFNPENGKHVRAHRFAYELAVGPIGSGLVLDHLCRNRACVNPAHLEPVTNRENVLRGEHPNAVAHRTNTCRRGHSLSDAIVKPQGRECRTCTNAREAVRRQAARQPAGGVS